MLRQSCLLQALFAGVGALVTGTPPLATMSSAACANNLAEPLCGIKSRWAPSFMSLAKRTATSQTHQSEQGTGRRHRVIRTGKRIRVVQPPRAKRTMAADGLELPSCSVQAEHAKAARHRDLEDAIHDATEVLGTQGKLKLHWPTEYRVGGNEETAPPLDTGKTAKTNAMAEAAEVEAAIRSQAEDDAAEELDVRQAWIAQMNATQREWEDAMKEASATVEAARRQRDLGVTDTSQVGDATCETTTIVDHESHQIERQTQAAGIGQEQPVTSKPSKFLSVLTTGSPGHDESTEVEGLASMRGLRAAKSAWLPITTRRGSTTLRGQATSRDFKTLQISKPRGSAEAGGLESLQGSASGKNAWLPIVATRRLMERGRASPDAVAPQRIGASTSLLNVSMAPSIGDGVPAKSVNEENLTLEPQVAEPRQLAASGRTDKAVDLRAQARPTSEAMARQATGDTTMTAYNVLKSAGAQTIALREVAKGACQIAVLKRDIKATEAAQKVSLLRHEGVQTIARREAAQAAYKITMLKHDGAKTVARRKAAYEATWAVCKMATLKREGAETVAKREAAQAAYKIAELNRDGARTAARREAAESAYVMAMLKSDGAKTIARRKAANEAEHVRFGREHGATVDAEESAATKAVQKADLAAEARLAGTARLTSEAEGSKLKEELGVEEERRAKHARLVEEVRLALEARVAKEIRCAKQQKLAEEATLAEEERVAAETRVAVEATAAKEAMVQKAQEKQEEQEEQKAVQLAAQLAAYRQRRRERREATLRMMMAAAERKDEMVLSKASAPRLYTPRTLEILRSIQRMQHRVRSCERSAEPGPKMSLETDHEAPLSSPSSLKELRALPGAMQLCAILREKPSLVVGPLLVTLELDHPRLFEHLHHNQDAVAATVTGMAPLVLGEEALEDALAPYAKHIEQARTKANSQRP